MDVGNSNAASITQMGVHCHRFRLLGQAKLAGLSSHGTLVVLFVFKGLFTYFERVRERSSTSWFIHCLDGHDSQSWARLSQEAEDSSRFPKWEPGTQGLGLSSFAFLGH